MEIPLSNFAMSILNNCVKWAGTWWPQRCLLCEARAGTIGVCASCYAELPWLTAIRCPQCAMPTSGGEVCGACLGDPPRFDAVDASFAYAWPLAPVVRRYKYGGTLALSQLLAQALAACVKHEQVDVIIPMPLAPQRLRERGFNQALEIARVVSTHTGVKLVPHACRRVLHSAPQAALPWKERAKNIRGAFVCDVNLSGKRVAVVDDVMTTGATLNELSRNLRQAGASEIRGWIVARTLPR